MKLAKLKFWDIKMNVLWKWYWKQLVWGVEEETFVIGIVDKGRRFPSNLLVKKISLKFWERWLDVHWFRLRASLRPVSESPTARDSKSLPTNKLFLWRWRPRNHWYQKIQYSIVVKYVRLNLSTSGLWRDTWDGIINRVVSFFTDDTNFSSVGVGWFYNRKSAQQFAPKELIMKTLISWLDIRLICCAN